MDGVSTLTSRDASSSFENLDLGEGSCIMNSRRTLTRTGDVAVHLLRRRTHAGLATVHGGRIRARSCSLLTPFRAPRMAFRPRRPCRPSSLHWNQIIFFLFLKSFPHRWIVILILILYNYRFWIFIWISLYLILSFIFIFVLFILIFQKTLTKLWISKWIY